MAETFDIHHPDIVRAFAAAWASIDGKLDAFELESAGMDYDDPRYTGHYEGYMAEASELLRRAGGRITAFDLFDRLSPPPMEG